MSTMTDAIVACKTHVALHALIDERVFTDLPEDLSGFIPCVELRLLSGPPFQNGDGSLIATMERWRFTLWANDAQEMDGLIVPLQDALLTLWGDYEVQLLESSGDKDPRTGLFWRFQDARFIGCV